ncbi:MAG: hypothetical protein HKN19_13465 [Halioglobus sp.]|nr:hypothetical protein [Halioglobus sp.]
MTNNRYLGMQPGDLDGKPYAKYWNPEMAPLSPAVVQALLQSPYSSEEGLLFSESHRLLEPGRLAIESGYTRLATGEMYVAVNTPMPEASGKMIDWWFGWHSEESQRYKLWHPRAHIRAEMKFSTADNPAPGDRERYVGNTSFVDEYIGTGMQRLAIQFRPPSEFGLDESRFAAAAVQTAVCANVGPANAPFNVGKLVHLIRETPDGCEMRSRFWLGRLTLRTLPDTHVVNRLPGSRQLARIAVGRELGHDMLVHCAMEMAHLASFLPQLYADYH